MAHEEETRGVNPANAAAAEGGNALARREASTEIMEIMKQSKLPVDGPGEELKIDGTNSMWASVETSAFFLEYQFPMSADQWKPVHDSQWAKLKDLAVEYRTSVKTSLNRRVEAWRNARPSRSAARS